MPQSLVTAVGLEPLPLKVTSVPPSVLRAIAAFGRPSRYTHWTWGKALHLVYAAQSVEKQQVIEMLVPGRPCQGFLLQDLPPLLHQSIMIHLLAHTDFLHHNKAVQPLPTLRAALAWGDRYLSQLELKYRQDLTEILDAALIFLHHPVVLLKILTGSTVLSEWQRDVLNHVYKEALWYQALERTKLANEGWAYYWQRLLTPHLAEKTSIIAGAKLLAQVKGVSYRVGARLFAEMAKNGKSALLAARSDETDETLLEKHLTPKIAVETGLISLRTAADATWPETKQRLICHLTRPFPLLTVQEESRYAPGDLVLSHCFDGRELDRWHLVRALPQVYRVWGRPVHLETTMDGKRVLYTSTGGLGYQRSFSLLS